MTVVPDRCSIVQDSGRSVDPGRHWRHGRIGSTAPGIGEALRFLRMSGIFYCPSELTEPWGLSLPADGGLPLVPRGHLGARARSRSTRATPLGRAPATSSSSRTAPATAPGEPSRRRRRRSSTCPTIYLSERYAVLRHGGGGARTDVVCGGVRFDRPRRPPPARRRCPTIIHMEARPLAALGLVARHARPDGRRDPSIVRPGSDAVVSRLCDILVIQAIRAWIERRPRRPRPGWLGALHDDRSAPPSPGPRRPGRATGPWRPSPPRSPCPARPSPPASPSSSANQPCSYVTRWRMHHAADLLATSEHRRRGRPPRRLRLGGRVQPGVHTGDRRATQHHPGVRLFPTAPSWASVRRSRSCR